MSQSLVDRQGRPSTPLALTTPASLQKFSSVGSRPGTSGSARLALAACSLAVACQPLLRPSGPGNSSLVDVFVLGALGAAAVWVTTVRPTLRAPYLVPTLVLVLAGALSGLVSPLPTQSVLTLVQDLVLLVWCVVVVNVCRMPGGMGHLARVWACASVGWAAIVDAAWLLHITPLLGQTATDGNRVLFTFGDPNYAGAYWVCSVFVVVASGAPAQRGRRMVGYVLLLGALLLTESNGAVLQLAVGGLVLVIICLARHHLVVLAVAAVLLVAAAGLVVTQTNALSSLQTWARDSGQPLLVNSLGRSNDSSAQRSILIDESLQLYEQDGLLGSGPATTKQLLEDRGYPYAKEAHDDYLAALVERGPLGVVGMGFLALAVGLRLGMVLRRTLNHQITADLPHPDGVVAGVIAIALAGTFYEVLHFRFVWILLAFLAVLALGPHDTAKNAADTSGELP